VGFVTRPMQQLTALPHLLQGSQIATLVTNSSQTVTHELLGYERQPFTVALHRFGGGIFRTRTDAREGCVRPVSHPTVQLPVRSSIISTSGHVRRVLGD